MEIKIASEEEIKYCYNLLHQIRTDMSENDFLTTISEQLKNGYKVAYVINNNQIICVVGFTISKNLSRGKHIQIEDFVTTKNKEAETAAKALLDFIKIFAKQQECKSIHIDSNVDRHSAHKFYLSQDFQIESHHFSFKLN
ncbi:hypothetical protein GCM10012288_09800 [Malaciobacter pacificus]|uniref:Uncharacterized protein n=1 Tax=Malaciobacter pacificus TaxID=1080223 RepID=A0A5C2HDY9_9BACT|nr:GNAT family N-acetyltransferase [Malaciobacter pacificus]QEP34572.1 hypothetical protein APAC_1463 [Malaciobacter pacificus]GGD37762.1 hypothetical protein GCM10012288_09800 [Malaciobacter pacificus]